MDNPFEKRASESILGPRSLLPLVSPGPMDYFYSPQRKALFEKLTIWIGSPGCGKTTLARTLELDSLLVLGTSPTVNKELAMFLADIGVLEDGAPSLLTHRIPMTTNFRSIWELPYSTDLREDLLRAFVQSKSVLGWMRQLERAEIDLDDVEIVLREDAESARAVMRTGNAREFRDYARTIELGVFKIVTALVPPSEEVFTQQMLNSRYDVFEEIIGIKIKRWPEGQWKESILKPMVVIDDAHELHPNQYIHLRDWLKSRVITISRWIMCRLDIVAPEDYRDAVVRDSPDGENLTPGSKHGRDYYVKLMQTTGARIRQFRKMSSDIADRYFARLPSFAENSVKSLAQALLVNTPKLSASHLSELKKEIDKLAGNPHIAPGRLAALKSRVPISLPEDEQLAILRILLHREINNSPQLTLLDMEPQVVQVEEREIDDDDPSGEAIEKGKVRASVAEGARIQLMHQYKRPFYFGLDKLSDASDTNIEQFISLTGPLVSELMTKIIRRKSADLTPLAQHLSLQKTAQDTMNEWDFPYRDNVQVLVNWIADRCLERTMLGHAPLDDGANAFGVLQEEMDAVLNNSGRMARILHFAFAYKALVMVPHYNCKKKRWCLLELGGIPILAKGLTLSRGGFVEGKISDLDSLIAH
ncbi:hypothetical protein [Herbaspirillum seropedicae]|uniref:hypothetical protein n=1 Tax=Herbaspirillum seropedicae TaxID=964 RepID=UPI0008480C89|nr:hypothetical protein [Herbaspirillum seropedicae]AON52325.1 hypothetical protein Hsc_0008 [Herbaspirillum seropedicae]